MHCTCLAGGGIFLFEHFGQSLFITFVEEWDLKIENFNNFNRIVTKSNKNRSKDDFHEVLTYKDKNLFLLPVKFMFILGLEIRFVKNNCFYASN